MTALTSFIGHLPMLYATGSGADIQKPLAVVVMGGLITSTLLTLIVLPTIYEWFDNPGSSQLTTTDPNESIGPSGPQGDVNMKEIKAYIKPLMLTNVVMALKEIDGLTGLTVTKVQGFGRTRAKGARKKWLKT